MDEQQIIKYKEDMKTLSDSYITHKLAQLTISQKEIAEEIDILKDIAKERNITLSFVPSLEKKVVLSEGRASTNIDMNKISIEFIANNKFKELMDISTIVAKRVDEVLSKDDPLRNVIEQNTKKTFGEPFIQVLNMTKKELQEHIK